MSKLVKNDEKTNVKRLVNPVKPKMPQEHPETIDESI